MYVPASRWMLPSLTLAFAHALPAQDVKLQVAYPPAFCLFQRETPTDGVLRVRGTYPKTVPPGKIEVRWAGSPWQVLDAAPTDGAFAGELRAAVGQGNLELRATAAPALTASVECVGIGDLFLITGQSNADGRGDATVTLDATNPFVGVKFRRNAWSKGDDPSANDTDNGSPWPMVLNELIPDQEVPMGYIQAAVGSTVVKQWRKGGDLFTRMFGIAKAATDGTMRIRAVLYYQGENDITHHNTLSVLGDYTQYRDNLAAVTTDFHDAFSAPFLLGQITNLGGERERNDNVRRAQQEAWGQAEWVRPGAVAYDILPSDGVHYRTEPNLRAFAQRWTAAIRASVYGRTELVNPTLSRAELVDPTTVRLTFDRKLKIESWDGKPGDKAMGFSFRAGDAPLTDADVQATEVMGESVTLKLAKPLKPDARLFYGSGADGQGKPVLRDTENHLPVRMIFDTPLQ